MSIEIIDSSCRMMKRKGRLGTHCSVNDLNRYLSLIRGKEQSTPVRAYSELTRVSRSLLLEILKIFVRNCKDSFEFDNIGSISLIKFFRKVKKNFRLAVLKNQKQFRSVLRTFSMVSKPCEV